MRQSSALTRPPPRRPPYRPVTWILVAATALMILLPAETEVAGDETCLRLENQFESVDTAHSVTAADLNMDGHLDLIVVAHFPTDPGQAGAAYIGDGQGNFAFSEYIPIGDHNHGAVLVDLNHDGFLDLVTSSAAVQRPEAEINVGHTYLGDGTGRFGHHGIWPIQRDRLGPLDVQTADLNRDGHLDLVATGAGRGHVAVLEGDGSGHFGSTRFFTNVLTRTRESAIADFDQDGDLDAIVTNRFGNSVSLLLGDGAGNLEFSRRFRTGFGPRSVTAQDFNGDGQLDVAVTCRESAEVSVLLGRGEGAFGKAQHYPVGTDPRTIVATDLDEDGMIDLAVTNTKSQTVTLLFGNGQGQFLNRQDIPVGDGPIGGAGPPSEGEGNGLVGLFGADVNEDGHMDLLVTSTYDDNVYVLMNHCRPQSDPLFRSLTNHTEVNGHE